MGDHAVPPRRELDAAIDMVAPLAMSIVASCEEADGHGESPYLGGLAGGALAVLGALDLGEMGPVPLPDLIERGANVLRAARDAGGIIP